MTSSDRNGEEVEQERLRQAAELAADGGENWAQEFQPGSPGCHELLDRTALLADMLERHLLDHPACVASSRWYQLAAQAANALQDLYQQVGAEHLAADGSSLAVVADEATGREDEKLK